MVGKVIEKRKSYGVYFQIGFVVSFKKMKHVCGSKGLNLTYSRFLKETIIKVRRPQVRM